MMTLLSVVQAILGVTVLTAVTFAPQIILFVAVWLAIYMYRRSLNGVEPPTILTKFLDTILFGFKVAAVLAIVLWIFGLIALGAAIKADSGVVKQRGMLLWSEQYLK